ncbi:protein PIH1D3 [Copidosoma floridanum]|uniref:protein PIH1D3 n=1 Tax=Copidosoma floridanum TaxID=29053 RepID=UPI0006C99D13|nr:protein PIH1D3 [Copidosoma floridanum]
MEGFTYEQIKDLQQLFAVKKDQSDSDSDDDLRQRLSRKKIGPGSIGKPNAAAATSKSSSKESSSSSACKDGAKKTEVSDIWHSAELNATPDLSIIEDPRKVPEYEMKFKQSVGTEDIFLGMNLKTPSTASCEWLTLRVKLPSETREKIELSVESDVIDIRSPKYRLRLPTPFPVDPNGSSAKWHSDSDCLEITLKLSRELDNVNF